MPALDELRGVLRVAQFDRGSRVAIPDRATGLPDGEVTLVTTLLDPVVYPAIELAELYAQRWQIETNLRHLKQTLRMDVLRTKTVAGVQKELLMFAWRTTSCGS